MKKKRSDKFLKDETIVKNQKNFRIFISTSSNEYNLKKTLLAYRTITYDENILKTSNIATQRS